MKKTKKIRVGISIGDLNGVGSEIVLKSLSDNLILDFCTPVIFASVKTLSYIKKILALDIQFQGIDHLDKIVDSKINVYNVWKEGATISWGAPSEDSGKYALQSFQEAVKALKNDAIDILVTAPIDKGSIQSESFKFPGHTDYLEQELEGDAMMLITGKIVYGPYAADSFFGSGNYKNFDAILAAYHDQGLIPFKTLSFGKGVNYTAGLNRIRTSPDHGTAYDIAGKGVADHSSFNAALFEAINIFKRRQDHMNLTSNILKPLGKRLTQRGRQQKEQKNDPEKT